MIGRNLFKTSGYLGPLFICIVLISSRGLINVHISKQGPEKKVTLKVVPEKNST